MSGGFSVSFQQPGRLAPQGKPVQAETKNYVMRSLTAADVTPAFVTWFDDPLMLQGLNIAPPHFSVDGLRAFVASFNNRDNYLIGIFAKADDRLLGFYNFSVNLQHRVASATVGTDTSSKIGRALLWETMVPMFDAMFEQTTVEKVSGRVLLANRRMVFALMGGDDLIVEAVLRQEILGPEGKRLDVMAVARFKDKSLHVPYVPRT